MIKKILKNKMFKNASWLIFGKIFQMLLGFVVSIFTARYLGPSNYGIINYAAAYTAFFASVCTLGINSVIVKEFVDNPGSEGKIIGTSLLLRGVSSFLSVVTIIGISFIADADEPLTKLIVFICSLGLIFNIFETFNYYFQFKYESKKTAVAALIAYTLTASYKVILLINGKSVIYFAFATSVDYICIAVILYIFYICGNGQKLSFSWKYGKNLLSKSYHFILPGLMVAIYGYTDKIMLKHMISDTEIGLYSTAVALCNIWCFVLSAIIDSMYPAIMQTYSEDKEKYLRLNRSLYCIIFYISVFVAVLFQIFSPLIIRRLYGEEYMGAVNPLRIITWYTAFSYLGVARNAWIVCENKQRYLKHIYFSAAISNVILNIIFIPIWGASGAAVASLLAQIITTLVAPFFIKPLRENSILMLEAIVFKGIKK